MTYTLGLLGVLQMMLLPGLLLYRLLNDVRHKNFWLNLPLILALSFIFNYFLVIGLTYFHVYLPPVLWSIVGAEMVLLLFAYPRFWALPMLSQRVNFQFFVHEQGLDKKYTQIYFGLFLLIFALCIYLWLNSWGQVFGIRDPAVSYNRWAISWAHNQFPILTWHYPQLLTTNWSIAYVMMGNLPGNVVLEMFPASLNLIFPILFMLLFLDLFKHEHNRAYLLSAILLTYFIADAWAYILHGHMDWVCAFLNFLALKLIYQFSLAKPTTFPWRAYIQIILVIAASALAKPAGITTLVLAPLLLASLVRFEMRLRPEILLLYTYLILILLVMPWYVYAEYHETINTSHGADLLFLIWGIFRFSSWSFYFYEVFYFGWAALILLLIIFFFSKSLPKFWRFAFYFYSPYFFVWAFLYSYDMRNLDILLPVLTTCAGLIIAEHRIDISLGTFLLKYGSHMNRLWLFLLALFVCAEMGFLVGPWTRNNLIQHEIATKNHIYDMRPGVIALKNYVQCPGLTGKMISPMLIFDALPVLAPHMVATPPNYFGTNMLPAIFSNLSYLQAMLAAHPDIHYLLFDMRFFNLVTSKESRPVLKNWLDTKKIKPVLKNSQIVLYEIEVPLDQLNYTVPKS